MQPPRPFTLARLLVACGLALSCSAHPPHDPSKPIFLPVPGEEARLAVWDGRTDGDAPVVVLHGGPGACVAAVQEFAPLLKAIGRSPVLYEQRGAAQSGPPSRWSTVSYREHVADLETLRRWLGVEQLDIVGHSWGGVLAAAYAKKHPTRVGTLVLVGPGEIASDLDDAGRTELLWVKRASPLGSYVPHGERRFLLEPSYAGALHTMPTAVATKTTLNEDYRWCRRSVSADARRYFRYTDAAFAHDLAMCACGWGYTSAELGGWWDFTRGLHAALDSTIVVMGDTDPLYTSAPQSWVDHADVPLAVLSECAHRPHVECPNQLLYVLDYALRIDRVSTPWETQVLFRSKTCPPAPLPPVHACAASFGEQQEDAGMWEHEGPPQECTGCQLRDAAP